MGMGWVGRGNGFERWGVGGGCGDVMKTRYEDEICVLRLHWGLCPRTSFFSLFLLGSTVWDWRPWPPVLLVYNWDNIIN